MKGDDLGGSRARLPWRLFWTGLIVRLLYIVLAHSYHFRALNDHFQYGWEAGRIARALATGYGYADPFSGHTGPTAWLTPIYPLIMAGAFKLFGVYTPLSAFAILAVNSIFSAATAPAVYEIAWRCYDAQGFGRRVALWSGWIWALYPAALQYAVRWLWEMSITACVFAWILVIALRFRRIGDTSSTPEHNAVCLWSFFGVLWAAVALSNPSLLLTLPVTAIWMLMGSQNGVEIRKNLTRAGLAAILFLCCTAPWVYRNWRVFQAFIPTRGNFGAELCQSVLPSNGGFPWGGTIPPTTASPEFQRYRSIGEVAYVREQGAKANVIIATDRSRIVGYAFKRIYFFWFGVPKPAEQGILVEATRRLNYCFITMAALMGLALSLHRKVPAAGLFASIFLVMPLPYYMLTVQARFRHPLEPVMTVLIVFLFQSAVIKRTRDTSKKRVSAGAAR
ncbi:hypothetical protein H7846_17610 [Edaphobacter sp. 4G125]|nr:hypothetical protein H7846_17610 [Edaphobacter sp. 4G125]